MPATCRNEKPAKTMPVLILRRAVISVLSSLAARGYIQASKVGMSVSTRTGLIACSCFRRKPVFSLTIQFLESSADSPCQQWSPSSRNVLWKRHMPCVDL